MQANSSPPPSAGHEDKQTQRAVLAFVLDEFPARHTRKTLRWMGFGEAEVLEEAIRTLDVVGLLWLEDDAVLPTAAARHFDWLDLS